MVSTSVRNIIPKIRASQAAEKNALLEAERAKDPKSRTLWLEQAAMERKIQEGFALAARIRIGFDNPRDTRLRKLEAKSK
ncbi:MAG: hypothetical protein PHD95_01175 [Candidatus ainarchaeum sp.]|nr:hypothetical protein [Candidatus ainarchaeum sp.]